MKNLIIKIALMVSMLSGSLLVPLTASALNCDSPNLTPQEQTECGACAASGDQNCDPGASPGRVQDTIKSIVKVLTIFGGAVAVVMIIVGGFRYITSDGNAESAKGARNTIIYAVIGLVVISLAQIIVHFTLNSVK